MKSPLGTKHAAFSEYATFYLKDALCGIALDAIQEINKPSDLTVVPQAPDYVMGIVNLRGKIVTVIDTGKRLGLNPIDAGEKMRTIIVNDGDESVGLMVDRIANVVKIEPDGTEAPPANIGEVPGRCFDAVYKTEDRLVGLLSLDSLVRR
jgi:purine-binding chemotaxis protein CheW